MSLPVRIAHVMGKMHGGGVEAVVMNYYRHIDREKVQFDLIIDADSTDVPRDEVESMGGRVFVVPPYQKLPKYLYALEELFRREQWSIVHSHVNALSVFPLRAAKRAGVPVRIAHSHSTSGKGEFAKSAVKRVLCTQANRYPSHRMACSEYAGRWLFGEAKFAVLHNAIDLSKFAFDESARREVRVELGITEDDFVVGHVGRFMTQKNHAFLVDVFAEVVKRESRAILILVGSGELEKSVQHRVAERGLAGKVRFLGQRPDTARLYQAFDVFCLPSLYEGLGVVAVEAQRAGLPCLVSERVPREVALGSVRFLPISDQDVWASTICSFESGARLDVDPTAFVDYDIERAAVMLTERYSTLSAHADAARAGGRVWK